MSDHDVKVLVEALRQGDRGDRLVADVLEAEHERAEEAMRALAKESQGHAETTQALIRAVERAERMAEVVERIVSNAESWHGVPDENDGHVKALTVIAEWGREALARLDEGEGE